MTEGTDRDRKRVKPCFFTNGKNMHIKESVKNAVMKKRLAYTCVMEKKSMQKM